MKTFAMKTNSPSASSAPSQQPINASPLPTSRSRCSPRHALVLGNGSLHFTFTNSPGAAFSVLATTNLAVPLTNWTLLGAATEGSPGQYQFTDPGATNFPTRYYRVRYP